jgi:perosamine synthetase
MNTGREIAENLVGFVRDLYRTEEFIPLHAPIFQGNEKRYLLEAMDSTFVSSVGEYVDAFEQTVVNFTGAKHAIATVNGTAALHVALKLSGVEPACEVITQSLTFVATCNAIRYCEAVPVFVDVDEQTLALSANSLESFLEEFGEVRDDGYCWNRQSNRRILACLPMHTFGFPADLDAIKRICDRFRIVLVEDAAESLGSQYKKKHTGLVGLASAVSFNGNKIITTGGGGMILTNDSELAVRAKHLTTTAKRPHKWDFVHDEIAYNYRLPNLNAALGVAQMEMLQRYLKSKREIADAYHQWGRLYDVEFVRESVATTANYWLNALVANDRTQRDEILQVTNAMNIMTRPAWTPMHRLEINKGCQFHSMVNTDYLFDRLINVPSSAIL